MSDLAAPLRPSVPPAPVPRWLRACLRADIPDMAAFSAGAALALLDPLARCEAPVGGLWRQRLALAAAAANCALEGRAEREAELRDAWAFRGPVDDPGPVGRRLAAWRWLGETRAVQSGLVAAASGDV